MACIMQYTLIGRIDDVAHFEVTDPQAHPNFDFALQTKVRWSKNVLDERKCPDQILLGSMDPDFCVLKAMGGYYESLLRMAPDAHYMFSQEHGDNAP